jgi:hypothetical protein
MSFLLCKDRELSETATEELVQQKIGNLQQAPLKIPKEIFDVIFNRTHVCPLAANCTLGTFAEQLCD